MVDGVPDGMGDVVPPSASDPTDYTSQEAAGRPGARGRGLPSVQSSLCSFGGTDGRRDDDFRSVSPGSLLPWQSKGWFEEVRMGRGGGCLNS